MMPPTLQDFKARQQASATVRPVSLDYLRVAAVHAEALTGHPAWDAFLSRLQALLNEAEAEVVSWTSRCVNAVKEDDMRFAQRNVSALQAQVELLRTIMEMPNAILTDYRTTQP